LGEGPCSGLVRVPNASSIPPTAAVEIPPSIDSASSADVTIVFMVILHQAVACPSPSTSHGRSRDGMTKPLGSWKEWGFGEKSAIGTNPRMPVGPSQNGLQ